VCCNLPLPPVGKRPPVGPREAAAPWVRRYVGDEAARAERRVKLGAGSAWTGRRPPKVWLKRALLSMGFPIEIAGKPRKAESAKSLN